MSEPWVRHGAKSAEAPSSVLQVSDCYGRQVGVSADKGCSRILKDFATTG